MPITTVAVFGGSGFLGRHIVEHLLGAGLSVRVAVRRPERMTPVRGAGDRLEPVQCDIRDAEAVHAAVGGAQAAINAVSLYVERGQATFRSIHVTGARRVAEAAQEHGVERLLHISGIGADPSARSPYERCRGEGEEAVRHAFANATIFRPSVIFGPDDAFLNTLTDLLRRFPVLPLFGEGRTRLQPVFVGDVAAAAANAITAPRPPEGLYELGGPDIYNYRELIGLIMRVTGRRRLLMPFPFFGWRAVAAAADALPSPPLTESQVALMKHDNIASPNLPGLRDLDVKPTGLEAVLRAHFVH